MKELYNYINNLIYQYKEIEVDANILKKHIEKKGDLKKICNFIINTYDDIEKIAEIIW